MTYLDSKTLDVIKTDLDHRESVIRTVVYETLAQLPKPDLSDSIVASYFVWSGTLTPTRVGKEICYHMTSGVRHPQSGSLLDECTGKVVDCVNFDQQQRCGLIRVAFPLKMLRDGNGNVYSTDILHIVGGAGIFALTENRDAKLVDVAMSDAIMSTFPGPAYGAPGLRRLTNFGANIAFGTILKPCTGMTPQEETDIVYQAAANPMFLFVKEDENFLPGVHFAPVGQRAQHAMAALKRARESRGDVGIVFASHISSPPHLIKGYAQQALDQGVNGLMFSEYYCGGAVRTIREMTRDMKCPPAIYGHNGGISARTRHIYREVLDMFARLDGIDMRQTAPLTEGAGLLRPSGLEWRKCEEMLSKPLAGKPPVMIARAGGLDQGNIIQNLLDVENHDDLQNYLFLAGSAINSIKNEKGLSDPAIGARAMQQALTLYKNKVFPSVESFTVQDIKSHAQTNGHKELAVALAQRYRL